MSRPPKEVTWEASPHSIAKIKLVQRYLYVWAIILAGQKEGESLVYVDGFAGPGEYKNYGNSSPLAAIRSLSEARKKLGAKWRSKKPECFFIEGDSARAEHLTALVEKTLDSIGEDLAPTCTITKGEFESTLTDVVARAPESLAGPAPAFVFLDPFGAKGMPFNVVADLLQHARTEVLLNFDADGIARILRAGVSSKADEILDMVFGCQEWKAAIDRNAESREQGFQALQFYLKRLRGLPGVDYVFSFEMKSTKFTTNYFLVFATRHPLGLIKMKESMSALDQTGDYSFCDASVGQGQLFRFDQPSDWLPRVLSHFRGSKVRFGEVEMYVLNHTPFKTANAILAIAERNGHISVTTNHPKRRRGTFPPPYWYVIEFEDRNA
jgi:three-Cys-motif partner protein